jgi:subtilisin family serine protease
MSKMTRILYIALVASLIGLVAPPPRAQAAPAAGGRKPYVEGQVLVVPAPGVTIDQINTFYGSSTIDVANGVYLVQLPPTRKTKAVVREMQTRPTFVQAAGANVFVSAPAARKRLGRHQPQTFPNDTAENQDVNTRGDYDSQGFIDYLGLRDMTGSRGQGVTIAVIDTGADLAHPDLVGHFALDSTGAVLGIDYIDGGTPSDDHSDDPANDFAYGHGTFIAGLIAKIAPDARIMPIRALGADGIGQAFDVARAVEFALANGAHIVSMSFGSPEELEGLDEALHTARDRMVLFAAAGNQGTDRERQYPAEESFVLSVTAVDTTGKKAEFANWGSVVDLAAPGVRVVSTYPDSRYATWSGTSFATPMAAATAALVASNQIGAGDFDPDCVGRTLVETGRSLDELPQNNRFRGKMGRLIDPAAAKASPGCGGGSGGSGTYNRVELRPTVQGDDSSAGEAEREARDDRQELEVRLQGLVKNTAYTMRVTKTDDSTATDTLTVDRNGATRVKYSTDPDDDERALPSGLNPVSNIRTIDIVSPAGTTVLTGTFGTTGGGGGGDDDDDDGGSGGGDDDGGGSGGGDDDGGPGGGGGGDGGGDGGGGGDRLEATTNLSPAGTDLDASGDARWRIDDSRQRFDVECLALDPATTYELWVDGVYVDTVTTDEFGHFELDYDTESGEGDRPLPPSLMPVSDIQLVEIRRGSETVLSGSFT